MNSVLQPDGQQAFRDPSSLSSFFSMSVAGLPVTCGLSAAWPLGFCILSTVDGPRFFLHLWNQW